MSHGFRTLLQCCLRNEGRNFNIRRAAQSLCQRDAFTMKVRGRKRKEIAACVGVSTCTLRCWQKAGNGAPAVWRQKTPPPDANLCKVYQRDLAWIFCRERCDHPATCLQASDSRWLSVNYSVMITQQGRGLYCK